MREKLGWGGAYVIFIGCVACGSDRPDELEAQTRSTDLASDRGNSAAALAAARDRIRKHFENKREKSNIVATTTTRDGQIIDWTVPTDDEQMEEPAPARSPEPLP